MAIRELEIGRYFLLPFQAGTASSLPYKGLCERCLIKGIALRERRCQWNRAHHHQLSPGDLCLQITVKLNTEGAGPMDTSNGPAAASLLFKCLPFLSGDFSPPENGSKQHRTLLYNFYRLMVYCIALEIENTNGFFECQSKTPSDLL